MSTANVDDSADSDDGGPSEKRSEFAERHRATPSSWCQQRPMSWIFVVYSTCQEKLRKREVKISADHELYDDTFVDDNIYIDDSDDGENDDDGRVIPTLSGEEG